MNYTELERKINENKSLDFGNILSDSIELFKKTWKQGVLHSLLSVGVFVGVLFLILIPLFLMGIFNIEAFETLNSNEPNYGAVVITYLILLPILFIASVFVSLLNIAFYNIIRQIDLEETSSSVSFGMFFKTKFIVKASVISFLSFLISIVAVLACYLPVFYVIVPLTILIPIFAFNTELSSKDLIKACFKLGTKKWFIIFGLTIISGLLAEIVGLLLCGIGLFFTISFVYLPLYYVYKGTVGFEKEIGISDDDVSVE